MNIADILGWIGNVGFYWQIEGNTFYLVQGILLGMSSLILCSAILIVINIFGIINWRKIQRRNNG